MGILSMFSVQNVSLEPLALILFINNDLPCIILLCASRSWTDLSLATLHTTTEWEAHAENIHIIVSLHSMFSSCAVVLSKRGTKLTLPHRICRPTTTDTIITTIKRIAPPHHPPDMSLSTLNNSCYPRSLQCPICPELLCQPLEHP